MSSPLIVPDRLVFDGAGLVPVVVQDRLSGDVLMVAYADAAALRQTAETGLAHFWSRRRQRLWKKGESSGHTLTVREMRTDCDRDVVLMVADPQGPACHSGSRTCFGEASTTAVGILGELARVIDERAHSAPMGSYTARLLSSGPNEALKKVGEEATEFVLAARTESEARVAEEAADLLYHLLVALKQRSVTPAQVMDVLRKRRAGR